MNTQPIIPNAETRARNIAQLLETSKQLEALSLALEEVSNQLEADLKSNPLYALRLEKAKQLLRHQ